MAARKLSTILELLASGIAAATILALLVIGLGSSALGLIQRPTARHQTGTPSSGATATPTASPTPSPTPTPPTPLVYLTAHGNPHLHEIALTFDDGPAQGYTEAVLGVLKQFHIHATFFMLGIWVQTYPNLAREVVADGHAIGDHTWNHPDLTRLSPDQARQQIIDARNTIQKVTGITPTLFRPPYGSYNRPILDIAHSLKLSTILWNVDPRDWSRPGVGAITNNILTFTQNGSIILMHDGGGDRSQTVAALTTVIETLLARGFTFVTIPEMLRHLPPAPITQQP
ncbi:MAG TPA: polysaccharide deacetylase family protein [Ktedonobacterales bacterium]|nr:polysaccharide deacetylase family protein [Ktedonobacterales bacterium]